MPPQLDEHSLAVREAMVSCFGRLPARGIRVPQLMCGGVWEREKPPLARRGEFATARARSRRLVRTRNPQSGHGKSQSAIRTRAPELPLHTRPHPRQHMFRTCSPPIPHTCSALVPHLFRTCSALVPHLFGTCSTPVPHLYRTCSAPVPHSSPHFFRTSSASAISVDRHPRK